MHAYTKNEYPTQDSELQPRNGMVKANGYVVTMTTVKKGKLLFMTHLYLYIYMQPPKITAVLTQACKYSYLMLFTADDLFPNFSK